MLRTDVFVENEFRAHADIIYRLAYARTKSKFDSDDILQEVFIKYMKKTPEFHDEEHEKAWFLRVTINTSKDYLKSFWFRRTEAIDENIPYECEEEKDIWELVQKLSPKYRSIIQLFYQEGYSIKEISKILKIKETTVGSQLSRARELLRKLSMEA
jgi:RNA polymerase sigma-70 factor (ECF subfamily)